MKKVLGVFFLLCVLAEQSRAIFFNTLNGLLQPPPASAPMPPGPSYVAYIDPHPPKPPVRPHYIPKAYPDYVVAFASPGGGIGLGSYSSGSPASYSPSSYGSSNYGTDAYNTASFGAAVNSAGIYGASALINDAQGAVAAAMAPSSSSSLFSTVVGADGNILLKNPEDALRQSPEGQAFLAYNQQATGSAASLQNVFLDGPASIFNPHQQAVESVSPVASSHSNIAIPSGSQFGSAQMTSGIGVTNQNAGPDLGAEINQLTALKGSGSPGTVSDVQLRAKPEASPASVSPSLSPAPMFSPPSPQSSSLSSIPIFDKSKSASVNPTLNIEGLPDIRLVLAPNRNRNQNRKPNAGKDSEIQSPRSIFHSSKLRDGEGRNAGSNPPYFPNFPVPNEENVPSQPWYVISTTPPADYNVGTPSGKPPMLVIETIMPEDITSTTSRPSFNDRPSKATRPSKGTRPPMNDATRPVTTQTPEGGFEDLFIPTQAEEPVTPSPFGDGTVPETPGTITGTNTGTNTDTNTGTNTGTNPGTTANDPGLAGVANDIPVNSPANAPGGGGFPGFFMPSLSMPGMGGMQPRPDTGVSDAGTSAANIPQASPGFIGGQPGFGGSPFFGGTPFLQSPFMQSPFMGNPFFAPPGNDALDIQVGEPIHVQMNDFPNGLRDVGFQPGFSNFQPSSMPSFQSPSFSNNFPNRPNRFRPNRRPPPNRDPNMLPNRPPPNRDPEIPSPPRDEFPQQNFQPQPQEFQPQSQEFQPQPQDFQPQPQEFQPQPQEFLPQQPEFQPSNNQELPQSQNPQPNFNQPDGQLFQSQQNENINYQVQQYPAEGFDSQGRNNFHNQQTENSFHMNHAQGPQDFNTQYQSPVQTVIRGENGIIQVPDQPIEFAPQQNPGEMQGEIVSISDEKQPIFNEIQISTPRSETENEVRPGYPEEEIHFSQPQHNQPDYNIPQESPQTVYNIPQQPSQPLYNMPQELPQPVYTPPQDVPQPIYNPPQELPKPVYTPENQETPQIIYTIENNKPAYNNEQPAQAVFNQGQNIANSYTPSQEKKQTGYAVEEEIAIPNQGMFGQRENINNQKASYGNSDFSSNVKLEESAVPTYSVYPRGPDYMETEASSPNSIIQQGVLLLEDNGYRPASQHQGNYNGPSQEKQGYGETSQDKQSNYQGSNIPNSQNPETQNPEYEYKPIAMLGPFYPPNPQEQAANSRYPSEDSMSQDKLGETGYQNQKNSEYQPSSVFPEYRPSSLYNNQDPSQPSYEGSMSIPAYSGNPQSNFPVPSEHPQPPVFNANPNNDYKPILFAGPFEGHGQTTFQISSDSDSKQSYGSNDINNQASSTTEGYSYSPFGNDNTVSHSPSEHSIVTEKSDTDNSVSPESNSKSESGDDYDPVALIGPFGSRLHPISRKPNVHIKHIGQGPSTVSEETSHSHDDDAVTASSIASYSTEYYNHQESASPSSEWFSHTESPLPQPTLNLDAGRFRSLDLSRSDQENGLEVTQEYGESVDSFSTVPAPMHIPPFPSRTPTIRKQPPSFKNFYESVTEVPPSSSTDETPAYDPILMVGPFGVAESFTGTPLPPENEYNPNNPFGMFGERSSMEPSLTATDRNQEYNPIMMVGPFGEDRSSTEIPIVSSSERSFGFHPSDPFVDNYPSSEAPHLLGMENDKYDPIAMIGPFGGDYPSTEQPPLQPQDKNQYDPILMVGPFGGESPATDSPEASTPESGAKYDPILMVGPFGDDQSEKSADAAPSNTESSTPSPVIFENSDGLKWYPSSLQMQATTPSPHEVADSSINTEESKGDAEGASPSTNDNASDVPSTLRSTPRRRRPGNRRRVLVNMRRKSTTRPPATYYPTTKSESVESSSLPYEELKKDVDNDVAESIDKSHVVSGNIFEPEKPESSNAVNPPNENATEDDASETASSATVSYEVTSTDSGIRFGARLHPKRRLIQHRRK